MVLWTEYYALVVPFGVGDEELYMGRYPGDMNSDDIVNILDLITFVSAILGTYELSYEEFKCVDFNRDYKIDILDVIQLVNQILIS